MHVYLQHRKLTVFQNELTQLTPPPILRATSLNLCPVARIQGLDRPQLRPGSGPTVNGVEVEEEKEVCSCGWGDVLNLGSYFPSTCLPW